MPYAVVISAGFAEEGTDAGEAQAALAARATSTFPRLAGLEFNPVTLHADGSGPTIAEALALLH